MASQSTSHPTGERLRALMREHDLRSEDVASRVHVSHRTVERWMAGSSVPHRLARRALAELFEVEAAEFEEAA